MKIQRYRFRLIALLLLCAFMGVIALCILHTGQFTIAEIPDSEQSPDTSPEETYAATDYPPPATLPPSGDPPLSTPFPTLDSTPTPNTYGL